MWDREKQRAYGKRWYQQHKEAAKKAAKGRYDIHKDDPAYIEKSREKVRRWRGKNREHVNAYTKMQRFNRKNAGELTLETIQRIYEDNIKFFGTLTCVYCKVPIPFGEDSVDHRIPLSRGGLNVYSNLVVACKSCNSKKCDKTWNEYFWHKEIKGEWV